MDFATDTPRHVRRNLLRKALRLSKLPGYLREYANDEGFGFVVPDDVFARAVKTTSRGPSAISDAAFWGLRSLSEEDHVGTD